MTKKQEDYDTVRKGVSLAINNVKNNLEMLTKNLDSTLSSIEASKMSEYTQSINAITRYEIAIQNKMKLLEQEQ